MVAVGSKSIPERQSISLDLSKETEDNLNTELFSEIFSSESINNNTTSKDENKSEIDKNDLELSNHNNKIPTNIDKNPFNESNSFSEGIGKKIASMKLTNPKNQIARESPANFIVQLYKDLIKRI